MLTYNHVVQYEYIMIELVSKSTNHNCWHGRKVVEISVVADALNACLNCGMPLQLTHAVDIQTYGLPIIIKIQCII